MRKTVGKTVSDGENSDWKKSYIKETISEIFYEIVNEGEIQWVTQCVKGRQLVRQLVSDILAFVLAPAKSVG